MTLTRKLYDTFTASDDTQVTSRSPDVGDASSWAMGDGSAANALIRSGNARNTGNFGGCALHNSTVVGANVDLLADAEQSGYGPFNQVYLQGRVHATAANVYEGIGGGFWVNDAGSSDRGLYSEASTTEVYDSSGPNPPTGTIQIEVRLRANDYGLYWNGSRVQEILGEDGYPTQTRTAILLSNYSGLYDIQRVHHFDAYEYTAPGGGPIIPRRLSRIGGIDVPGAVSIEEG